MYVLPVITPVQRRVVRGVLPRTFAQWVASVDDAAAEPRLPALDVLESDTAYTLAFDVPGATREQLKVSVEGRRVRIETADAAAEAPAAQTADAAVPATAAPAAPRTLYSERLAPRYARTVALPAEVDDAASQARVENGVLTLVLAKRVPTGARRISIG